MKFIALDRDTATSISLDEPYIFISIQDPHNRKTFNGVLGTPNLLDVLNVDFHDVDHKGNWNSINPGEQDESSLIRFNDGHAHEILDFYEQYKQFTKYILVHCDAGFCRSPAVCAALNKIHENWDIGWFKRYSPNPRVYSTILKVAHERGLFGTD